MIERSDQENRQRFIVDDALSAQTFRKTSSSIKTRLIPRRFNDQSPRKYEASLHPIDPRVLRQKSPRSSLYLQRRNTALSSLYGRGLVENVSEITQADLVETEELGALSRRQTQLLPFVTTPVSLRTLLEKRRKVSIFAAASDRTSLDLPSSDRDATSAARVRSAGDHAQEITFVRQPKLLQVTPIAPKP